MVPDAGIVPSAVIVAAAAVDEDVAFAAFTALLKLLSRV